MMRDYDRLALLFTPDGVVRIPHINAEAVGREEIRVGSERLQGLLDYFVQTTHPGTIQLDGDTASGRAYISELGRFRDGRSELDGEAWLDAEVRINRADFGLTWDLMGLVSMNSVLADARARPQWPRRAR
jgi:SnoaL-like domain